MIYTVIVEETGGGRVEEERQIERERGEVWKRAQVGSITRLFVSRVILVKADCLPLE